MKFYKIEVQAGGLFSEQRTTANRPAYAASQNGRLIYDTDLDQLIMGSGNLNDWVLMFDNYHSMSPDLPGIWDVGDSGHWWNQMHARDFYIQDNGAFHGDLDGDIYASNGTTRVLDNGSNGLDAWFRGDIYSGNGVTVILNSGTTGTDAKLSADVVAQNNDVILFAGSARSTSWASLPSIKNTLGADVILLNGTVANSEFLGISTRAKYA